VPKTYRIHDKLKERRDMTYEMKTREQLQADIFRELLKMSFKLKTV
jgi:hypothetical protein